MWSSELLPLPDGPVMAAASPGANAKVTSDRTVSGPRGVGYDLPTLETLSMGNRCICREETLHRLLDCVMPAHTNNRPFRQVATQPRLPDDTLECVGQCGGVVGRDEQ